MKDVAVVIINYNTAQFTLECIQSVQEKTSPEIDYEIVVVDNASEVEDYELLQKGFPQDSHISLHRSEVNTGFGGGNSYGTQFANAPYFLFLNNDTLLLNDCLSLLKNYMDHHPNVKIVSYAFIGCRR